MAAGTPWTDFELDVLYLHVHDLDWFAQVRHLIRDRTEGAIRTKMWALREETGIIPSRSLNARDRSIMWKVTGSDRLADKINALRERVSA